MAKKQTVIALDQVDVVRGGAPILKQLSWQVGRGENWVILGPNGAGKSTLARVIAGQEHIESGTAIVLGSPVRDRDSLELATQIGLASVHVGKRIPFETTALAAVLTSAWGQFATYDEDYEGADRERALDLLEALGVGSLAERSYHLLSEGEQRRVLLARALMPNPEVVFLDEPTAGLDLGGRETLLRAITEIMEEEGAPSVVMITHEPEQIAPGFTHCLVLKDGQVFAAGPLDEVLTGSILTEAFGLPIKVKKQGGRFFAKAPRSDAHTDKESGSK